MLVDESNENSNQHHNSISNFYSNENFSGRMRSDLKLKSNNQLY